MIPRSTQFLHDLFDTSLVVLPHPEKGMILNSYFSGKRSRHDGSLELAVVVDRNRFPGLQGLEEFLGLVPQVHDRCLHFELLELLTVAEAAQCVGCCEETIRRAY